MKKPAMHSYLTVIIMMLSACDSNNGASGGGDVSSKNYCAVQDMILPPDTPTYSEHIAPLITKYCIRCHSSGGIAPFTLESYQQAKSVADAMKISTASRSMPPFRMNASGCCQNFRDHGWLTPEEIGIFTAWADQGTPEGSMITATPPPATTPLGDDTLDLKMADFYTPPTLKPDDYRCFPMETGLVEQKFLTGYTLEPGDPRIVHHMLLYTVNAAGYQQAKRKEAASDPLGYTCFGGSGIANAKLVAAWAPGTGLTRFPDESGIAFPAGQKVVMQIHYNTASGTFPDLTTLKLELKDQVVKEGFVQILNDTSLNLPPQKANLIHTATFKLKDYLESGQEIDLWALLPHEHELGTAIQLERVNAAGEKECLGDIPRWDFNWQTFFFYDQAVRLKSTDTLELHCHFDTTPRTETTYFGEGTADEMCLVVTYITPVY